MTCLCCYKVKGELYLDDLLCYCSVILQEAAQSQEYKLFQKIAKTCRFFANTLVHYIKVLKIPCCNHLPLITVFCEIFLFFQQEFKFFLTKYCSSFHQIYLQIIRYAGLVLVKKIIQCRNILMCMMSFSKFPPSLYAPNLPTALSDELNVAALVPLNALLLQLLPLRPFAEVVLQENLCE